MKLISGNRPFLGGIILMIPGLLAGVFFPLFCKRLTTVQVEHFFLLFGSGAAVVFILVFTVRTFFVFAPYYLMLIAGGALFGRTFGLLYNLISVILSASLAYLLSRMIRKTIQKRFNFERYASYIELMERNSFRILVLMRITIIFPFDLLNYAAGLAGMRYRTFLAANVIGVIPEVVFLTCFGQSLRAPRSFQFIVLSLLFSVVLVIGYRYRNVLQNLIRSAK